MKNTIELKQRLVGYLVEFKLRIQTNNKMQLFDVNKLAQEFIAKLLNIIYHQEGAVFEDMDKMKSNYPAIDIADFNLQIGYQITSQNDTKKIYETITKFRKNYGETSELKSLKFIILNDISWTERQIQNIEDRFVDNKIEFTEDSIRTIEELEEGIISLTTEKQKLICDLFEKELGKSKSDNIDQEQRNELRKELFARFRHFYLSPWSYAESEEEAKFKKLLKNKDPISADLLAKGKYQELIEFWEPLNKFDFFDINHAYWSDKPFFRRFIQSAKMDLCISLCYLSVDLTDGFNLKDGVEILEEILSAPTYSTIGGSETNLSKNEAIHENNEAILFFKKIIHLFEGLQKHRGEWFIEKMLNVNPDKIDNLKDRCEHKEATMESINK